MKRTLCSVILAATLLIAPAAGFAQTPFDDIQSSQALTDIEAVYEKGIMLGTADNKFSPDDIVNRAQLAVCLVRTFDLNNHDLQLLSPLTCMMMLKIIWYSAAATIAGYNNIFDFTDRKFKPREAVTRAEAASAILTLL